MKSWPGSSSHPESVRDRDSVGVAMDTGCMLQPQKSMPELKFTVRGSSQSPACVTVKARKFTIIVDEPAELGGEDRGPNPVEYVLASLVGCVNVVAHLVAVDMGLVLKALQIEASGALNPDRLLGNATADRAGYKSINLIVRVSSEADEATLQEWLRKVRSRCPVSDNLANETPLSMELAIARE